MNDMHECQVFLVTNFCLHRGQVQSVRFRSCSIPLEFRIAFAQPRREQTWMGRRKARREVPIMKTKETLWIVLRTLSYAACGTLLFIAFVMATRRFDRRFEAAFSTWTPVPGILLTALGGLLIFVCVATFVVRGRGTPLVLDAPRQFVASGPYQVVRNPLYIGSTTFFLGMGLYLRLVSVLLLALGWAIFVHLFVVYFEEPELNRKFGATYEAYCAAVPRWMPRVRRTKENHQLRP